MNIKILSTQLPRICEKSENGLTKNCVFLGNSEFECSSEWLFLQNEVQIKIPVNLLQPQENLFTFQPILFPR